MSAKPRFVLVCCLNLGLWLRSLFLNHSLYPRFLICLLVTIKGDLNHDPMCRWYSEPNLGLAGIPHWPKKPGQEESEYKLLFGSQHIHVVTVSHTPGGRDGFSSPNCQPSDQHCSTHMISRACAMLWDAKCELSPPIPLNPFACVRPSSEEWSQLLNSRMCLWLT